MDVPGPGTRVRHALYGDGAIVAFLAGLRAKVRFDDAKDLPRVLSLTDLTALRNSAPGTGSLLSGTQVASARRQPPVSDASPRLTGAPDPERRHDARQAMEAIRLGVVPARCVREYTVGRDHALKAIDQLLRSRSGLRILWGDYGAGKTHLLDVIETVALEQRFVTARATLDPRETPPSHPQRLFRAVVRGLNLPGGAGAGLSSLLGCLSESPDHCLPSGKRASRFFSPYLWALHRGSEEAAEAIHDYLIGEPVQRARLDNAVRRSGWKGPGLLMLSDFRTYGRVYMHMLGTLATWSRDAGYQGLLLLFDEVEYVDALDRENLRMARDVLDHVAAATLPEASLAFPVDSLRKGGHAVHRALPLRFEPGQPLMVVMAATPLPEIRQALGGRLRGSAFDIPVPDLDRTHIIELVRRIYSLYREAYPAFRPGDEAIRMLADRLGKSMRAGEECTRSLVRTTITLCDELRLSGGTGP